MWLRTIFRRRASAAKATATPLDERMLRRLERLAVNASRGLRGGLAGTHRSMRRLPAQTVTDHRPYASGDDLRYLDWNAYGRHDDLHLKLGESEQDVRLTLVIDCSASMDWGEGDLNKLHYARMLAAAIGYIALSNGDRLEVVPFGLTEPGAWGPASGRGQIVRLMSYLETLRAGGGATAADLLRRIARRRQRGLVVVVSDLWHTSALQEALAVFEPPRWQVLLLHLLHPDELRPPWSGELELEDSESGERLELHADARGFEQYGTAVQRWREELALACGRRNMAYAPLMSDMVLERAAVPYLKLRQVLR